jgi:hypothetical protein
MAPAANIHPLPVSEKQHDPPTTRATPRPPPKPNLTRGKGDVTFALPPGRTSLRSPEQKKIWRSPGTSYVFTPAQVVLMAGATESAPRDAEDPRSMFSKPPSPPANDIRQGEHCSLMQPQPLADVHPFTPVMNKWRQGIKVDCGPDWSWDDIEVAVARGPHPTTSTPEAVMLFADDIAYQVKAGFG